MSTATPVIEAGGTYAAVMDQGAGEMNLAKAVTTKAYLTAEGTYSNRPKLRYLLEKFQVLLELPSYP